MGDALHPEGGQETGLAQVQAACEDCSNREGRPLPPLCHQTEAEPAFPGGRGGNSEKASVSKPRPSGQPEADAGPA